MSDTSQGPGWWQASDGKWYPPDQHPGALPPPPPNLAATTPPPASPPGYGPYPGAYQMPYGPPPSPGTNGFAVASLVLGILWLYWIGSILALVFGYKAKGDIDRTGGRQGGRGMAVAGIVLGWIGLILPFAVIVMISVAGDSAEERFRDVGEEINSDPADGWCDEDRYWQDPDC